MRKKLGKSGDSKIVVLPKAFLDLCEIENEVEIGIENKTITISRPKERERKEKGG